MKSNFEKAEELMVACDEVWNKLNICCGRSSHSGNSKIGYSVEEKRDKHDSLLIKKLKELGYSNEDKVPRAIREILQSENYHSLNRVLQDNKLGEGNF